MENKNDNGGAGCLIILIIVILVSHTNMKEENKIQTDAMKDEIRQLRNELEYRR